MKQAVIFIISLLAAMSSAIVVSTSESPAPTFEPSPSTSGSSSPSGSGPPSAILFQPHSDTRVANLFSHYDIFLKQYNLKAAECEILKQECEKRNVVVQGKTLLYIRTLAKCTHTDPSTNLQLKATSNCIKENSEKEERLYIELLAEKIDVCGEVNRLEARMNEVEAKIQSLLFNDQQ
ncbi:hypothetical protein O5D80_002472 [Batrachochytrium dendrobatidis]|nr:hypothetical protein O5D80_002472 [Batrachochytrium dendrobatidis]